MENYIELKKNQIYEANIVSWSSDGGGVCRIDGRAVFVPGAIPGERWEIRILKVTKTAIFAKGESFFLPLLAAQSPTATISKNAAAVH